MIEITEIEKSRLIDFINENELDYDINTSDIFRFNITSHDGMKFFFYKVNEEYVIVKYDKRKDNGTPGSIPYEYFQFKTLPQVLEQISFYDKSLNKVYWSTTPDSIEIGFIKEHYKEDWYDGIKNEDFWTTEDCGNYTSIVYSNPNYKPELKSPYNTIHEVSPINQETYTVVEKLYFEIHPISCLEKRESYLLKLLINNEEVFKEYVNYIVSSKKGLKLLIENIFNSVEKFKI